MKKRFLVLCLVLTLLCSAISVCGAGYDGYVFVTVEKITLGQGLVVEPLRVGYYDEDTLADILERSLGEKSIWEGGIKNYYLEHVIDGGEPEGWTKEDIPADILAALKGQVRGRAKPDRLSAFDYSSQSGWMVTVDNCSLNVGAGSAVLGQDPSCCFRPGSVIRLQYSLYGYGEDVGIFWGTPSLQTENTFPDRSELIRASSDLEKDSDFYQEAIELLSRWQISQQEIDDLVQRIEGNPPAEWAGSMNFSDSNNQVTDREIAFRNPVQKWQYALNRTSGSWGSFYAGQSVIIDDYLYATGGGKLHKINTLTGKGEAAADAGTANFYYDYLCYGDGLIFVGTASKIQVFDAKTMQNLGEVSGSFGNFHPVQYHNGYVICNGFIFRVTRNEEFVLQPVRTEAVGGDSFGWSSGVFAGDSFYVAGTTTLYRVSLAEGTVQESFVFDADRTTQYSIGGQLVYDEQTGYLYWGSYQQNTLHCLKLTENGSFDQTSYRSADAGQQSTCAPVVYNKRLYLAGQSGKVTVMNADPASDSFMEQIYMTENSVGKIQGNPILTTAYEQETGKAVLYVQGYTKPGNLYYLEDCTGQTEGQLVQLTDIASDSNSAYSFEQIAVDQEGRLYCYNEEGYLYCFGERDTITVSAYDYTASDKGVKNATKTGEILRPFEVCVTEDMSACEAVGKAFRFAGITSRGVEEGYVTSINGLGSGEGYSGWCLSYNNDDYSNGGLSSLTLVPGDALRFDYSCNFDTATDDIGNGWYGLPIITSFSLGGAESIFGKSSSYDQNDNLIMSYFRSFDNGQTKAMEGSGTEADPFILPVLAPEDLDLTSVEAVYTASLNPHYCVVEGLEGEQDFSDGLTFSISSLGGNYKSYYQVVPLRLDEEGCLIEFSAEQGMIAAEMAAPKGTRAFLAVYDKDGRILSVKQCRTERGSVLLRVEEPEQEYSVKYFLWTEQLEPLLAK